MKINLEINEVLKIDLEIKDGITKLNVEICPLFIWILAQAILIASKQNHTVSWSWWIVFIPSFVWLCSYLFLSFLSYIEKLEE